MENRLDKIIDYISPTWSRKRVEERLITRSYQAATNSRLNDGWIKVSRDENKVISSSINTLRARSLDLFKNDGYSKQGINLLINNIVGTGIRTEFENTLLQEQWEKFSNSYEVDFDERYNYLGLQYMALQTAYLLGDCLLYRRRVEPTANFPFSTRVQLLPPQYLDHSYNINTDNGKIVGGIEFDRDGKRIYYHIFKNDPLTSEGTNERVRIPASDIVVFFKDTFLGQQRGLPELTNCMTALKDIQQYEESELKKQRIHSAISGFITQRDSGAGIASEQLGAMNPNNDSETIEIGSFKRLKDGESVEFPEPPVLSNFPEHIRQSLLKVSSSLGVPACLLTSSFEGMNYSSFRGAWLAFHKMIDIVRSITFIPKFCNVIEKWFLEEVAFDKKMNTKCFHSCPKRELIDPQKEIPSLIMALRSGLDSYGNTLKGLGHSPDQILEEIAKYNKKFDELGIVLTSDARNHEKGGPSEVKQENSNIKEKKEDDIVE